MKDNIKKYFSKELIGLIILVFSGILFYFLLSRINDVWNSIVWFLSIFKPFLWAFVIAYFVNFFVVFFEKKIFNDKRVKNPKNQRRFSMIAGYLLALVIVVLVIVIIVPQTINSLSTLVDNAPTYINNFLKYMSAFVANHAWAAGISDWASAKLIDMETMFPDFVTEYILPYTVNITTAVTSVVINLFIAIVVSIYFISSKEKFFAQIKKVFYAHMKEEKVNRLIILTKESNNTFSNFISGKLLDSLIIGIITFIILSIFNFPYSLLISVIIGITNIIPFFGPIIGAVPSVLIIAIISPVRALWFILFILVLQQVDGNIIGPKIIGYSIGISAVWIIFSIVIGNKLIGVIGMLIGAPAFAVCYKLFKDWTESKLKNKGLPTETKDYASEKNKIRF